MDAILLIVIGVGLITFLLRLESWPSNRLPGPLPAGDTAWAMSEENVEVVRAIYEALNRSDWDAAFRLVDPDFEVTFQRGPNAGTHRGRDTIEAVIEDQRQAFDAWGIELEKVFDSGDQVVALIRSHLRPKGTEAEFDLRNGHIWTIRDGAALSLRGFPNPEEALEAAGLSE
jgi:ketosteroid isomerase-like protein